jgi:hypothetical protein
MLGLILRSFTSHLLAIGLMLPTAALLIDEPPVGAPATHTLGTVRTCVPRACKRPRNHTCAISR